MQRDDCPDNDGPFYGGHRWEWPDYWGDVNMEECAYCQARRPHKATT